MSQSTISELIDSEDPFYAESNVNFLKEGIKALNEGKGVPHELIEELGCGSTI